MYRYAAQYKHVKTNETDKNVFIDTLKTLWLGRFGSYAKEVENMDINEAEKVIQNQAKIFEDKLDILLALTEEQQMTAP